ncbi:MAG: leucine-rich repeat protein [Oscillospiraceae bacterium]|nr:leucine-rich repeat protein [Oscillospiraceae bacterium]
MKLIKHITSTALSMMIIAGTVTAGYTTEPSANAATTKVMYSTVLSQWKSKISSEQKKFPNYSYWNHKGISNYNDETYSWIPCDHVHEKVKGQLCCSETKLSSGDKNGQCNGFAYKLAKDIWGTTEFYTNNMDSSYVPKVGDNVRLNFKVQTNHGEEIQPHSIFITDVSGSTVTFAECNGELEDCRILWGRKQYYSKVTAQDIWVADKNGKSVSATVYKGDYNSLKTVNTSYLRTYGANYSRPIIAGDLNHNDVLDSGDAMIFADTVMKNGRTMKDNHTPLSYYDVNADGRVDYTDYNEIRYGRNNLRIVLPNEETVCRWRSMRHDGGFTYNGSYYVKSDIGGVAWIGSIDSELESLYVDSRVYDPVNERWCNVTEIGYDALHISDGGGNGWRTCTDNYKIKKFYIPNTVKKIHSYAFENWTTTTFGFSGSNSQLELIDRYAFYNCKNVKTLDLTPATKLKDIKEFTFDGCTALYHIDLPFTGAMLNIGSNNGSVYGNTDPRNATIEITNPNNSTSYDSYFQKINIGKKDYDYWKDNRLYFYGKIFKLYYQNGYIGQVGRYLDYLRP